MIHKCIFLIISSHDNPVYEEFRNLHRVYLKNYLPLFRYFFVEFRQEQEALVVEENDYIYIKGEESINPGMILKTCKAMEYINFRYEYEFVLRTNLSTVFNIPNLIEYLYIIPNTNSCGGFNYRSFITGTGIILSKDVSKQIVDNFLRYDLMKHNEDIIISGILNKFKTPYYNCKQFYKWGLIIDKEGEDYGEYFYIPTNGEFKDFDFPNDILQFRIKNTIDRKIDIMYFKLLLKKLYDIVIFN
jgi:hypothetical protein